MRCDDVRPELVALERGEFDPAFASAVRAHLSGCAACAAEARRLARAIEAVARATTLVPTAEGSSRLMAAVDDALVAERIAASDAAARRGGFRVVRGLWEEARARYERSAPFRRFTVASLALHAAAAAFLAFVLSRPEGDTEDVYSVTAIIDPTPELADRGLPPFEAATAAGSRSASGRAFPNASTARRLGDLFDAGARETRLARAFGEDAAEAKATLGATADALAARQSADGSFADGGDPARATALAAAALAAAGRDPLSDPTLLRAAVWLEERADVRTEDTSCADLAAVVEARSFLFAAAFDRLDPEERVARRDRLARSAEALARRQGADGSFEGRDRTETTLAATRALASVREVGVLDAEGEVVAAAAWLDARRTTDGRLSGADRASTVTRTAELVALAPRVGGAAPSGELLARLGAQVASLAPRHAGVAAVGIDALASQGVPIRASLQGALAGTAHRASATDLAAHVLALARPLHD